MKKRLLIGLLSAGLLVGMLPGASVMAASDPKLNVRVQEGCILGFQVKANFWKQSEGFDLLRVTVRVDGVVEETFEQPYQPDHVRATWDTRDNGIPVINGPGVVEWRADALLDDVVQVAVGGSFLCA